jgi:hypothetical protein
MEEFSEMSTEEKEYPGIEFTPPPGSVPRDVSEGEALIRWTKVGDKYTIIEFEGEPIKPTADQKKERASRTKEKKQMSVDEEIDQMAYIPNPQ